MNPKRQIKVEEVSSLVLYSGRHDGEWSANGQSRCSVFGKEQKHSFAPADLFPEHRTPKLKLRAEADANNLS